MKIDTSKLFRLRNWGYRISRALEKHSAETVRKWLKRGNTFICTIGAISLILLFAFYNRIPSVKIALLAGMEELGIMISCVIYYSYMQDPDSATVHTWLFATQIVSNVLGMFLNGCSWVMDGIASMAFLNRLCVTALHIIDAGIIFQFWLYAAYMLGIEEKSMRITKAQNDFFNIYIILLIINLFFPFMFTVDPDGFFRKLSLYPLTSASLLLVIPPIINGLIHYRGTGNERQIASAFLLMPMIGMAVTFIISVRTAQYCGILLSILLAMSVMIADRGKRMAAVQAELDTARNLQASMLPQTFPPFPDRHEFEIYATMDPARKVGGDFYDFFMVDDDHLALVIADVSDKGVPAALLMMSAKILINFRTGQGGGPGQILAEVNDQLYKSNESGMFATVWLGILDLKSGVMTCANAGHENPAIREDGRFRMLTDPHGLPLGVMSGMRYRDYTLRLRSGDAVFVYTDGIPEANNAAGELYTQARMELTLNQILADDPESVLKAVRADVDAFVNGAAQFDDLTMLCLTWRGSSNDAH